MIFRLGWAPSISIKDGVRTTHAWIKGEIEKERAAGGNANQYSKSEVVVQVTDTLDGLNKK